MQQMRRLPEEEEEQQPGPSQQTVTRVERHVVEEFEQPETRELVDRVERMIRHVDDPFMTLTPDRVGFFFFGKKFLLRN